MKLAAPILLASTLTAAASAPPGAASPAIYEVDLFDARPERQADAADLLTGYAAALRSAPGCLRVDLARQPPPTANHFVLVTVWRSDRAHDLEASATSAIAFRTAFQRLAASPVDERRYARTGP